MKTKKLAVICIVIIILQLFWGIHYAMSKEYYLIARGNEFAVFSMNDDVFTLHKTIKFTMMNLRNFEWPSYNQTTHELYFQGISEDDRHKTDFIYRYNSEKNSKIEQLFEGRLPSLSPDGRWLAYYRHPNQLWIINLENTQSKIIAIDINDNHPPVWIAQTRLLYSSVAKQLISLDVLTKEKLMTGHEKIIPGSLSPDGKTVLCSNYDSDKIILYTISANKIETIKESKFLSIGSSFIWCPDGKCFLYSRQTWSHMLKISEIGDLFLFSLQSKTEKRLAEGITLFGGVAGDF